MLCIETAFLYRITKEMEMIIQENLKDCRESFERFRAACLKMPVLFGCSPLQEISLNTLAWVFSWCPLNRLSGGHKARETDHRQDFPLYHTTSHTASHTVGHTCLRRKHHPYLSWLARRGLGLTVTFNPLILKLCSEVLQQSFQHWHCFLSILNKKAQIYLNIRQLCMFF